MERRFRSIAMADIGVSDAYDLVTVALSPRPVVLITSVDPAGGFNVAPFSFVTLGGANPPSVVFSAVVGVDGHPKETLENVRGSGEFVVNSVHREMAAGLARISDPGRTDDKWQESGFSSIPGVEIACPRIAESLVQLECRLFQIVEHGNGPGAARYVIGEVVRAHIAEEILAEGRISGDLMYAVARMGGKRYIDTARLEFFS